MKKQLLLFLTLLPLMAMAHDIAVKNADGVTIYYNWINNKTELAVTGKGSKKSSSYNHKGNVIIPESVTYQNKIYSVTAINDNAFGGCENVTSITIPNSVKTIGRSAFSGCKGLTSVTIPSSVISIEGYTFAYCSGLVSVTISDGVMSIGDNAFEYCYNLVSVAIPNSVTSIGDYSFWGCRSLMTIEIPNSMTSIGNYAFAYCPKLTVHMSSATKCDGAFEKGVNIIYSDSDKPLMAQPSRPSVEAKKEEPKQKVPKPVLKPVVVDEARKEVKSDVDQNIPSAGQLDKNTFVVVIGNEKYEDESDVPFAENDARVFAEYCKKTLGVSEKHIRSYINAGYNDIRKAISWLRQGLTAYEGRGRVIFYYAGHGVPNESDKSTYLLPVDGISSDIESAYPLSRLYQSLSELPAQSVTVFLDACFSGAKRDGQIMASARGVAIKAKPQQAKGKMVVFSAAQGAETAYPFQSKQHGMFTYYLLKKLQQTQGQTTLGELSDYLRIEVKRESFDENNKIQTPTVNASPALGDSWKQIKLRR